MADLAIIIPTRGRPENIRNVIGAWDRTDAWDVADMILAVDADDPEIDGYLSIKSEFYEVFNNESAPYSEPLQVVVREVWQPMVHKLDTVAVALATGRTYWALGFAGDDHLPRTINWARAYLAALADLKSGMVYGDDGYQHENLSSEWALTSDVVRALGRMVPAPVEHMYSDVSLLELMREAGAVRYLPQVVIEHMHPIVGKAANDDQYKRVNHRDQMSRDRRIYEAWQDHGKATDLELIKALQPDRVIEPAATGRPRSARRRVYPEPSRAAWGTGRVARSNQPARSGPTTKRGPAVTYPRSSRKLTPRHLRDVTSLTPPEVGITLADMARNVPADQAIVELGVHHGYTALMMAWGARQGNGAHVWGFDPWDLPGNVYEGMWDLRSARVWAQHHVRTKGHGRDITLTQLPSIDAATLWEGPSVGLLYVDGAHEYDAARADILSWLPHLAVGATIAVDDYNDGYKEHVVKAVDDLVSEGILEPVTLFHTRLAVTKVHGDSLPIMVNDASKLIGRQETVEAPVLNDPEPEPVQAEIDRMIVHGGEVDGVAAGTSVDTLNLVQLKALAKARSIVLGKRKDKRSEIVDAIRAGK